MSSSSDLKFRGYAIHDTKKWTDFKVIDFEPKSEEELDITIAIDYCGVCGSDVHTITGGWGELSGPVIPGHEIVGKVVKVGSKVTEFKVGDRAGVGAQVFSCLKCPPCKSDNENYCPESVDTYNASYPNGDVAQGGYSTGIRVNQQFVFPIPDGLESVQAAPMLCAGLTVYSPLFRHGAGPGKKVGIVGVGGLGHYAIQFAKALGSEEVIVFSHSANKKDDCMKMGASAFVQTSEEEFTKPYTGKLDLIICCADVSAGIPLTDLLTTLTIHGKFIVVAMPDEELPAFKSQSMAGNGCLIGGSHIGSKKEAIAMLKLAVEKGVKSWVEEMPMSQAGKAVESVKNKKSVTGMFSRWISRFFSHV